MVAGIVYTEVAAEPPQPMVLPDRFIDQDAPAAMYAAAGLDAGAIVARALAALGRGDAAGASRSA